MVNDSIADALASIKNTIERNRFELEVPYSNLVLNVLNVMKDNAFVKDVEVIDNPTANTESKSTNKGYTKRIKITLNEKEGPDAKKIRDLKKISRGGRKVYRKSKELKPVLQGYGIAIVSTSKGVMTDKEARKKNTGGEVICEIY